MTDPGIVPHVSWCEVHGKKGFTKKNAKKMIRVARRRDDTGMREYPCQYLPNLWHTGHLPQATLWGTKTVREVYRQPPEAA